MSEECGVGRPEARKHRRLVGDVEVQPKFKPVAEHAHVPFVADGVRACAVCDVVLEGAG